MQPAIQKNLPQAVCGCLALFLTICLGSAQPTSIVDRMVGLVNGKVITQSDLQEAARWNSATGQPGHADKPKAEEEALRFYMERILIRQEIENYPGLQVSEEEIQAQMERLQAMHPDLEILKDPSGPAKIRAEFQEQLLYEKFIDLRFRHFIEIRTEEIDQYYRETFSTEWKKTESQEVPALSQVQDQIRRLLEERKIHQQLDQWIEELRQKAEILVFPEKLRFIPEGQERRYVVQ